MDQFLRILVENQEEEKRRKKELDLLCTEYNNNGNHCFVHEIYNEIRRKKNLTKLH